MGKIKGISAGMPLFSPSLVSEGQFVEVNVVGLLLVISIHLVIDGNAPPRTGSADVAVGPVEVAGHPTQRDGLLHQLIVGIPLHLEREMVPVVLLGITGNTRRNPMPGLVVPYAPLIPAG